MQATDHKQIYWRSRRGMLELELKLVPFVRDCFSQLSKEHQAAYERLLGEEDWQIFDWLQQREQPDDRVTGEIIAQIIAHSGRL
ncbi:MAG: succinate dehydrogenase assembly factor 2 [Pseudomonadota bacterium]